MNLSPDQIDKLKRTWAADRSFDLCGVDGTQPYYEDLREFERKTRQELNEAERVKRRADTMLAHEPEIVWSTDNHLARETMKRTRLGAGYLYTHTVIIKTQVTDKNGMTAHVPSIMSDSMAFVPEAEEYILSEHELTDNLGLAQGEIRGYLHTSKDYPHFISRFDLRSEAPEVYFLSLRRLWYSYWGLKL